jgi:arginine decarboxylase
VYTEKAIEMVSESLGLAANGHRSTVHAAVPAPQKAPKKKPGKRGGNGDRNLPEVGHEELLGQQQPGDALTAAPAPAGQGVPEIGTDELIGEQQPGDAVQADAAFGGNLS